MAGTDIIGALVVADAAILALVPLAAIKLGRLPEPSPPRAILIRSVSEVERHTLTQGAHSRVTERVSVAIRAEHYDMVRDVLRLVRTACNYKISTIAGHGGVSVRTAGTGPELTGPDGSFERTLDFRVTYLISN